MVFKYGAYQKPDSTDEFIYRPTIEIVFKYKNEFILVDALIDSGADFTILPAEMSEALNISLNQKTRTEFLGAGGNKFIVYQSADKIEHIIRQPGFRSFQWESKVYFANNQSTILLGQTGFLNRFQVTFDGPKKQIEINQ